MSWLALNCPQCSAPLPRVALWRAVKCPSCGALITKSESIVSRSDFKQALARMRQDTDATATGRTIGCQGRSYALEDRLGTGAFSDVHRARRVGMLPILTTIKLSTGPGGAAHLASEASVLQELHDSADDLAASYVAQCLPRPIACGPVENEMGTHALVLRHPTGYWGSLADLTGHFPGGIDPRHAVWIWRRMLDLLKYVHTAGWAHGDIRPEHALVHPADHGVRIIGWAAARRGAPWQAQATDLIRCARVVRVLLCGSADAASLPGNVPTGLVDLLNRTGEDEGFCRVHGAAGIDRLLRVEARNAFGPPVFVELKL